MKLQLLIYTMVCCMLSCGYLDKEDIVPAYINIDSIGLETEELEGDPVHKITDAWVFANEVPLGVFPLPARVPVITTGTDMNIRISPGIKPNGSNSESFPYPFFQDINLTENLSPAQELNIRPSTKYDPNLKFDILEDFEEVIYLNKDLDEDLETRIIRTTKDASTGQYAGLIALNIARNLAEFTTNNRFSASNNAGGSIWLEFDYKTEVPIYIGYNIIIPTGEIDRTIAVFKETNNWNRVYLNLTNELSQTDVIEYRVYFRIEHEGTDPTETFLDNIKLIHY